MSIPSKSTVKLNPLGNNIAIKSLPDEFSFFVFKLIVKLILANISDTLVSGILSYYGLIVSKSLEGKFIIMLCYLIMPKSLPIFKKELTSPKLSFSIL